MPDDTNPTTVTVDGEMYRGSLIETMLDMQSPGRFEIPPLDMTEMLARGLVKIATTDKYRRVLAAVREGEK
jgi:hypothetical protein